MGNVMRGLTVSQPWASLIASGQKWIENRTWFTPFRGPLAIHAGKGTQYLTAKELREYPTGKIIAICELVDCFSIDFLRVVSRESAHGWHQPSGRTWRELYEHDFAEGPWCWILGNIQRVRPVECQGALGLWTCPLEREQFTVLPGPAEPLPASARAV